MKGLPTNFKDNLLLILFPLLIFFLSYLGFGFFYERYEPFLTGLFSGVFTPGMLYNHFYFFGHVGLLSLYAKLYAVLPNIPWLNVVLYIFLSISLMMIAKVFFNTRYSNRLLISVCLIIGVFYMEQYVFFIYTRISFMLSFAALFYILSQYKNGTLTKKKYGLLVLVFVVALLTRSEPVMISLLVIGLFDFIVLDQGSFKDSVLRQLKLYFIPGMACLLFIGAFLYDVQHSDQFYKQIEPELEYELMSRNNITNVSQMTSRLDTFRFQAIFNGMWGDASTNNAAFLRSLVGSKESNMPALFLNGIDALNQAIKNAEGVFYLNLCCFFFLVVAFLSKQKYVLGLRLTIFYIFFWGLILLKSYKVKMIETALSPMLFMSSLLCLYLLLAEMRNFGSKVKLFLCLCFFGLMFNQLRFIQNRSGKFRKTNDCMLEKRKLLENVFKGKSIYLNQESSLIFADSYRPFEKIEVDQFNRVYYFDKQHLTTLEPYRSFLAKECNCDPNNYSAFFQFVTEEDTQAVFLMSESYKEFLSSYLYEVHEMEMEWIEFDTDGKKLYCEDKPNNTFKAYTVSTP